MTLRVLPVYTMESLVVNHQPTKLRHVLTPLVLQKIAEFDKQQWIRAIQARENTGALDNATVCINNTPVAAGNASEFNIRVVISWQGRQEQKANNATAAIDCGTQNDKRRLVVLESYIYLRS